MKKLVIAFDCDGTLIRNGAADARRIVANERIRTLLIILASMKNTKIIVWSGGGELWARQVASAIGINEYVDAYADKKYLSCQDAQCAGPVYSDGTCGTHHFGTNIVPDIAIDDIQACELGLLNLIVKEK